MNIGSAATPTGKFFVAEPHPRHPRTGLNMWVGVLIAARWTTLRKTAAGPQSNRRQRRLGQPETAGLLTVTGHHEHQRQLADPAVHRRHRSITMVVR